MRTKVCLQVAGRTEQLTAYLALKAPLRIVGPQVNAIAVGQVKFTLTNGTFVALFASMVQSLMVPQLIPVVERFGARGTLFRCLQQNTPVHTVLAGPALLAEDFHLCTFDAQLFLVFHEQLIQLRFVLELRCRSLTFNHAGINGLLRFLRLFHRLANVGRL